MGARAKSRGPAPDLSADYRVGYTTTRANVNGVDSFVIRSTPQAQPRSARRAILERVGLVIAVVGLLWVVFAVGFSLTDKTPPSGGSPPAVAR